MLPRRPVYRGRLGRRAVACTGGRELPGLRMSIALGIDLELKYAGDAVELGEPRGGRVVAQRPGVSDRAARAQAPDSDRLPRDRLSFVGHIDAHAFALHDAVRSNSGDISSDTHPLDAQHGYFFLERNLDLGLRLRGDHSARR